MRKTSSTNYLNEQAIHTFCNAAYTLSMISGRWKLTILVKIGAGVQRFSELKLSIPAITDRILALQLKDLEKKGLIISGEDQKKTRFPLYELTPLGLSMGTVITTLANWGEENHLPFSVK